MKNKILKKTIFIVTVSAFILFSCGDNNKPNPDTGGDLVNSSYEATGTPINVENKGDKSWKGDLKVINDLKDPYISITNWAKSHVVFLNIKGKNIYLDGETVIVEEGGLNWCFGVGYFKKGVFYATSADYEYPVKYDVKTKKLNFTGEVDDEDAVVGIIGRDDKGVAQSFYGKTVYSEVVFELTPVDTKSLETKIAGESNTIEKYLRPAKKIENHFPARQKIDMENVKFFE